MTSSKYDRKPNKSTRRRVGAIVGVALAAAIAAGVVFEFLSGSGVRVRDPANELSAQATAVEFVQGGEFDVQADYQTTPSDRDQVVALTLFTNSAAFPGIESVALSPEKAIVSYFDQAAVIFDVPPSSASRTRYVVRVAGAATQATVREIPIRLLRDESASGRGLHVYLAKDQDDGMLPKARSVSDPPGTISRVSWWRKIGSKFAAGPSPGPAIRHTFVIDVAGAKKYVEISNHCANLSDVRIEGLSEDRSARAQRHHEGSASGAQRYVLGVGLDFLRKGERGLTVNSDMDSRTLFLVNGCVVDDIIGQGTATADGKVRTALVVK